MLDFIGRLAENGVMGLVAAIALAFAWYQTKRAETLTADIIKHTREYAFSLADIFKLNAGEQANERPKTNPGIPSVGAAREPNPFSDEGTPGPEGESDKKAT